MPGSYAPTRAPGEASVSQGPAPLEGRYGPVRTIWRHEPATAQIAGSALAVVAIVLGVVALFGTWFSASVSGTFSGVHLTVDENFGVFGVSAHAWGIRNMMRAEYSTSIGYGSFPGVGPMFQIPGLLLISGIVLTGTSLRLGFARRGSGVRIARAATGIVAGVLAAAAPLFLAVTLPASAGSGGTSQGYVVAGDFNRFWGSGTITLSGTTIEMTWGAGWAWYAAFLVASLAALGGIIMAMERPAPEGPEFVPYRPAAAPSALKGEPVSPATPPADMSASP